ncbi:hypothetical protein [Rhizobium miluonense]|uniref:hypothetical protein n=1 Tax=Rhizobium miluonense TaxID=411945 RepID=UPI001AD8001F|nr:hypothetical protein [Rhizobium miluonense]
MAFVMIEGFPFGAAGKRRWRLKRKIGWSGLSSGSIRCFGGKRLAVPGGRHALLK